MVHIPRLREGKPSRLKEDFFNAWVEEPTLLIEDAAQFGDQRRQVAFDGVPQHVQVDFVVTMDKPVSHSTSMLLEKGWIALLPFFTHSRGGFTDNLDYSHKSQLQHSISLKIVASLAAKHLHGLRRVVEHVV